MLKRSWIVLLGIAALFGLSWSDQSLAGVTLNGVTLNGVTLNGRELNTIAMQAVRMTLPDGTDVTFR